MGGEYDGFFRRYRIARERIIILAKQGLQQLGVEEEADWHLFAGKWVYDTQSNLARVERETPTVRELAEKVPLETESASLVQDALKRRKPLG